MAALPIKVPAVSESITEGILANWLKPDGAFVKADEPLYELETDKASQIFTAPHSGILKILVKEGTTVQVQSSVGTIDPDGTTTVTSPPSPTTTTPPPVKLAPPVVSQAAAVESRHGDSSTGSNGGVATMPLAPAVRRIVSESNVDPSGIEGTGRGGRLTKGDVLTHLQAPSPTEPTAPPVIAASASPSPSATPRESRKRMSGLRQKIAQRLVEAQHTAAILTTFNEADMTRVIDLRAKYKDSFKIKHGVGLGFSSFFVKATIEALKAFPNVNGRIEGTDIVTNHNYDIGIAVSTERGLMVPVIRDADRLSFAGIEKAVVAFATKAREGTISVSDLQGGTFTITNGGTFGSLLSTPILNPPQSGILGMHAIQKRPVAIDDQVVIRSMMYLALSYDHRIVDGREAVSFLVRIKECIENPERMMLEL